MKNTLTRKLFPAPGLRTPAAAGPTGAGGEEDVSPISARNIRAPGASEAAIELHLSAGSSIRADGRRARTAHAGLDDKVTTIAGWKRITECRRPAVAENECGGSSLTAG